MNIAHALQGIVAVLWIVTAGFLAVAILRASRGFKTRALGTTVIVLAVVAAILTSISAGLVFVDPQNRGVVISAFSPKGYREQALQPGLHWVVPFFEYVKTYPISKQTYTMAASANEGAVTGDDSVQARTSDGQQIYLDASVIYEIDPTQVVAVHIAWQDRYTDELVRPQARGIIRDAVSQFNVEEVVTTKRFELATQIRQSMEAKLKENGLGSDRLRAAQYFILYRICGFGRTKTDRRAAGPAGQVCSRAKETGSPASYRSGAWTGRFSQNPRPRRRGCPLDPGSGGSPGFENDCRRAER